jgi:hypothetical protein
VIAQYQFLGVKCDLPRASRISFHHFTYRQDASHGFIPGGLQMIDELHSSSISRFKTLYRTVEEKFGLEHVQTMLGLINSTMSGHDDQTAHFMEDMLYQRVLQSVVRGNPLAKEFADLALGTKELPFSRWAR